MFDEAVYIPRLLDARERFIFLSSFEVMAVFGGFMVGQLSGQWVLALIAGIGLFMGVRRADQKGVFDNIGYYAYWYMPEAFLKPLQMNYFPKTPSYIREWAG